ncbi:MAG: Gfo/Idh/MocA family oxidoreductase [Leptospiraceae bacterium]|nr:Gfo/Idh/MocA family oxidoreductase [Leptospiraceae bacterium]
MKKVAIVGAGRIAWLLEKDPLRYKPCTHAGALLFLQKKFPTLFSFSDVIDRDLRKAKELSSWLEKLSPQKEKIACHEKWELSTRPDLVVIATTTKPHYELLMQGLSEGIPQMVIEKPVVAQRKEANLLLSQFSHIKSQIWPHYERRFHPKYQKIKSALDTKKWGMVSFYRALFTTTQSQLYPQKNYEGILLHDTTHLLDLVQFFFGKIKESQAHHKNNTHHILIEHENGICGEILTIAQAKTFHFELDIHTEKKRFVVGNGFLWEQKVSKSPFYSGFFSYTQTQIKRELPTITANNPFVRFYKEIFFHQKVNQANEYFQDALINVLILTQERFRAP